MHSSHFVIPQTIRRGVRSREKSLGRIGKALFLLASSAAMAATYHVSPTGNDTNLGTLAQPLLTIQRAATLMVAGDTVIVADGNYESQRVLSGANGTPGNPITFKAQSLNVIVGGFRLNHQFQVVDGFTINGTTTPANEGCVTIGVAAHNATVRNNSIGNSPVRVFGVVMFTGSSVTGATISNNSFFNLGSHGITTAGAGHLITQNTFSTTKGSDAIRILSSNTTVSFNIFDGWSNIRLTPGAQLTPGFRYFFHDISGNPDFSNVGAGPAPYLIGEANNFLATGTTPNNWGTAVIQSTNHADLIQSFSNDPAIVARNNLIEGNFARNCIDTQIGNISDQTENGNVADWVWRNNIWWNVDYVMSVYAPRFHFYNNTFAETGKNSGHPINFSYQANFGNASGGSMINNVFYRCGANPANGIQGFYAVGTSVTGITADYNLVVGVGAGTTKTTFKNGGREANGINGQTPHFVDAAAGDFTLLSTSPGVGAATPLTTLFTTDRRQFVRGARWDMGACEYVGPPVNASVTITVIP